MTHNIHSLKLTLLTGLGCLALTACVPGQYAYDAVPSGSEYGQYGAQSGQYDTQYGASFAQTRYGDAANAALRPPCPAQAAQFQAPPCGFMTVVPVYPIYQIPVAPEREPIVEIFEPPTVEISEPEPIVVYEPAPEPIPEPVYTPMEHWPEPSTPLPSWKPIRK